MNNLNQYLHWLKKLHRSRVNGGAPHKPILLLALLNLVGKGTITSNKIEITPEIVVEFKEIWNRLVVTNHVPNFSLPFYHMRYEPFWEVISRSGMSFTLTKSHSIKSLPALREALLYAELDDGMFNAMCDRVSREAMIDCLLANYFQETKSAWIKTEAYCIVRKIEEEIVGERAIEYRRRIEELRDSLDKENFEEELFIRGGIFKKTIPRIYDYRCAISGMRIMTSNNTQMVDACHIVPFAISKDDTITNGICLSPTLHRAFDRHLISIDDEYKIRVSKSFSEAESPFALMQFDGNRIILPSEGNYYPDLGNLQKHAAQMWP